MKYVCFFFFFFLLGFYEEKSLPDAIGLIMKSFQVIGRFKSNRKTYRPVTGGHQITSTKSLISLELTILTRLRLVTIVLGLGCKILNVPDYWTLLCCISYKDPFNDLIAIFKRGYDINPFFSQSSLLIPLKHQKTKGFLIFSGGSKENVGKKRVNHRVNKESFAHGQPINLQTKRGVDILQEYHTYWRSEKSFTKKHNSDYHIKTKNKKKLNSEIMHCLSGTHEEENQNIAILNMFKEF